MAALVEEVKIHRCPAICKHGGLCLARTNPEFAPYCGRHSSIYWDERYAAHEREEDKVEQSRLDSLEKETKELKTRQHSLEERQELAKQVLWFHHRAILKIGFAVGINTEAFTRRRRWREVGHRPPVKALTFDSAKAVVISQERWRDARKDVLAQKRGRRPL